MIPWYTLLIVAAVGLAVGGAVELHDRHRPRRTPPGVVTLDFRPIGVSLAQMAAGFQNMARVLGKRFLRPGPPTVVELQDLCGLGNRTGDGAWQSDLCASWVHNSCPLPAHCDCGCHA